MFCHTPARTGCPYYTSPPLLLCGLRGPRLPVVTHLYSARQITPCSSLRHNKSRGTREDVRLKGRGGRGCLTVKLKAERWVGLDEGTG